MESLSFKTVHASVRPPRVAVLVDKADEDWQNTCLRIIEFYSRLWGGAYNIIVPTDGRTIDERFWTILEAFDPDYLFRYQKSGEDLRLGKAEQYKKVLEAHIDRAVQENSYPDVAAAKADIDKDLRDAWVTHFEIASELQHEIKVRLAPFWFEDYAVDAGAVTACASPDFHLTDISKIILNTDHPTTITLIEAEGNLIPQLWYCSVTGRLEKEGLHTFEQLGIGHDLFSFREDDASKLIELTLTGDLRKARAAQPDATIFNALPRTTPFNVSMLQLGLYRSSKYQYWQEPLVAVAGNSFEDFCLYYCLSRLRDRVVWVLPSITDKALGAIADTQISRVEMNFIFQISNMERSNTHAGGTACVTYSLTSDQLDLVIEQMSRLSARQYASKIKKPAEIQSLIRFPLVAVERDNFQRDVAVQLAGDTTISPLTTPKPKHFQPIHPYEHRWITQLSIVEEAPPKHHKLGTWIVADHRLSTSEARVAKEGPAYFCPNVGYFGGDIDTVLVRPRLRLPLLFNILERLALDQGYECRPSDKGIYAEESIAKWGGLQPITEFLRNPVHRSFLGKFLDTSKSAAGEGVYLDDRRRYLDFASMQGIIGHETTSLIDSLILKQVLYRGFVFLCTYCRNAEWFSISDLTQEFKCNRCGRSQVFTKRNWKRPDEPSWFYKLDELVYQGYRHGMTVSLLALDYLRRRSERSFAFCTDREFWEPNATKPKVEADLFCTCDGVLTIGEAKAEDTLGNSVSDEGTKINKYKHLVTGLSAGQLIFATISQGWNARTVEAVRRAFVETPAVSIQFLDASHLLATE